ncbi:MULTISPECIES: sulfur carrier protein ThiS [Clostridia]|jgi:sulfur carrier protein|uniref:sulfur carrier protein ThiS n=1 Tax=Clostridia TaxID=186801 RepID=UPI001A9B7C90|nr:MULTISPECIES: sulfur carrier protein ThiS [Clostridiaceae]
MVRVNGNEISNEDIHTISELLQIFGLNENRVVIELNGKIVIKEEFSKVNLNETDSVEVISFVGGG